jgi:ABC-type transport system involved in multi-copper enzyme maturation permease subunit
MTERVGFSASRVGTIALNTFTESVRQKVYNILLIFALVAIASASFFAQFSFSEQLKFVKDFCLGALSVFGALIAIVGTAQMLPAEIENRTIYTILAKPVRRLEFLLGKYLGSMLLIFVSLVFMSVMFGAVLWFKEHRLIADALAGAQGSPATDLQQTLRQIRAEAFDPDLLKGVLLVSVKLGLLAAVTLLVSTFSTSMVFNVAVTLMVFVAGHLRGPAAEMWGGQKLAMALLAAIPDLGAFNVADDIILGNVIPWSHVGVVALYGVLRIAIVVGAAQLIFARREI